MIRIKRGATPTDAGKILYTHAWATLRQCERVQLAMHNVGQTLSGQAPTGFAPGTAASSIIMSLLRAARAEFPKVAIYPHENSGAMFNEKLINHQLDMVMIYKHSPVAGVFSWALLKEDPFLVGIRDCPGQSVDVSAIAKMGPFLPGGYSATRPRTDEVFSLRRLMVKAIGKIESIVTLTAAITSGMGVTVLPESAARSLYGTVNGWMSCTTTPSMSLSLPLNLPARANLSPQAQTVKELLMLMINSPMMEKRQW